MLRVIIHRHHYATRICENSIVKSTTAKEEEEEELADDNLEKCSVIELKDKLRAMNLPVSGRKAELIQRIREAK